MPKPVPPPIAKQLRGLRTCFWIWDVTHYVLGLSAALGAALIAADEANAKAVVLNVGLPIKLSVAVALATATLTFLKASAKANAYIQAWRHLHNEVVCFQLCENGDEKALCEAHRRAEEIIGKSD